MPPKPGACLQQRPERSRDSLPVQPAPHLEPVRHGSPQSRSLHSLLQAGQAGRELLAGMLGVQPGADLCVHPCTKIRLWLTLQPGTRNTPVGAPSGALSLAIRLYPAGARGPACRQMQPQLPEAAQRQPAAAAAAAAAPTAQYLKIQPKPLCLAKCQCLQLDRESCRAGCTAREGSAPALPVLCSQPRPGCAGTCGT